VSPLFTEKARLFPQSIFVIGHDTYTRLIDPKYYDDIEAALANFKNLGVRFIVGGRGGVFLKEDCDLFKFLTREEFSNDLSSTMLRAKL